MTGTNVDIHAHAFIDNCEIHYLHKNKLILSQSRRAYQVLWLIHTKLKWDKIFLHYGLH